MYAVWLLRLKLQDNPLDKQNRLFPDSIGVRSIYFGTFAVKEMYMIRFSLEKQPLHRKISYTYYVGLFKLLKIALVFLPFFIEKPSPCIIRYCKSRIDVCAKSQQLKIFHYYIDLIINVNKTKNSVSYIKFRSI